MKTVNHYFFLLFLLLESSLVHAQANQIKNPILPGFNPDPCIVRVDKDYYIFTSTFEWFPGIPVYHSRDLINWEQIGHVLTRESQLNMRGTDDSDGIFAPSITYHKGTYYLFFTNVQNGINWPLKGYPNYLVTARDPRGPWSEPVLINTLGFDPFLFIDDNDRAYVVYRMFDHRPESKLESPGIGMHALDLKTLKPLGKPELIYSGWDEKNPNTEGPKMLKKDGYYYLFTAEGGTGYNHNESVARSKNISGPYERAPKIFYTTKDNPSSEVQKSGHGTVFSTPDGEWYTTHLGSRPLTTKGNCPLGRESFIQKVRWNADGWPELDNKTGIPEMHVPAPAGIKSSSNSGMNTSFVDQFDTDKLNMRFQVLREPWNSSWLSLSKRKGQLALKGRRALGSRYDESLAAVRITSLQQTIETAVEFEPSDFRHVAGLVCYYNTKHFYSLGLTSGDDGKHQLVLAGADGGYQQLDLKTMTGNVKKVFMRASVNAEKLQFYYSTDGSQWNTIGNTLDFGKLSDDYARGFTGAMAGLFAQDIMYENTWAYFDYLKVK
ncbi:family 43 glycosylhydrolase [Sphingobacterium spiritivorum]|uniref:family 43 glycosylhydrolase n=1 Tax=Sphingobacterium spiritivorum TaxID=258 RepID=UPI003DA2C1DB